MFTLLSRDKVKKKVELCHSDDENNIGLAKPLNHLLGIAIDTKKLLEKERLHFLANAQGLQLFLKKNNNEMKGINKPIPLRGIKYFPETHFTDLSGWNQSRFLALHVYFLVRQYHRIKNKAGDKMTIANKAVAKEELLGTILEELHVAVNAQRLVSMVMDKIAVASSEEDIGSLVESFYNSLVTTFQEAGEAPLEICFPCGTPLHAVYLYFTKIDKKHVILRIDNVGAGAAENHNGNDEKRKVETKDTSHFEFRPHVISITTVQDLGELETKKPLTTYLKRLCFLQRIEKNETLKQGIEGQRLAVLYNHMTNRAEKIDFPYLNIDRENDWAFQKAQTTENCVYNNYMIGIRYRFHDPRGILPEALFDWFSEKAVKAQVTADKTSGFHHSFSKRRPADLQKAEPAESKTLIASEVDTMTIGSVNKNSRVVRTTADNAKTMVTAANLFQPRKKYKDSKSKPLAAKVGILKIDSHNVNSDVIEEIPDLRTSSESIRPNFRFGHFNNEGISPTETVNISNSVAQQRKQLGMNDTARSNVEIGQFYMNCNVYNNSAQPSPKLSEEAKNLAKQIDEAPTEVHQLIGDIPQKNLDFAGRLDNLETIPAIFETRAATVISQIISGLGGIGKTQLAAKIAYNAWSKKDDQGCWKYNVIIWLNACPSVLSDQFRRLGERLGILLERIKDEHKIIRLVHKQLARLPRVLWIFDNAKDLLSICSYLPKNSTRSSSHQSDCLVTSRNQCLKTWGSMQLHVLNEFTLEEARDYFKNTFFKYKIKYSNEEINNLAKVLGFLPLALAQAVAYIYSNEDTITQYLADYEDAKKIVLDSGLFEEDDYLKEKGHNRATALTTWLVSKKAIEKKHPRAMDCLYLCAYLHPDHIPEYLLIDWLTNHPSEAVTVPARIELCIQVIPTLLRHSMVDKLNGRKAIHIHRLVQEVLQLWLAQPEPNTQPIKSAKEWLLDAFECVDKRFIYNKDKPSTFTSSQALLPHAVSICQAFGFGGTVSIKDFHSFSFAIRLGTYYLHYDRNAEKALRIFEVMESGIDESVKQKLEESILDGSDRYCCKVMWRKPDETSIDEVKRKKVVIFELRDEDWFIHTCNDGLNYFEEKIKNERQISYLARVAKEKFEVDVQQAIISDTTELMILNKIATSHGSNTALDYYNQYAFAYQKKMHEINNGTIECCYQIMKEKPSKTTRDDFKEGTSIIFELRHEKWFIHACDGGLSYFEKKIEDQKQAYYLTNLAKEKIEEKQKKVIISNNIKIEILKEIAISNGIKKEMIKYNQQMAKSKIEKFESHYSAMKKSNKTSSSSLYQSYHAFSLCVEALIAYEEGISFKSVDLEKEIELYKKSIKLYELAVTIYDSIDESNTNQYFRVINRLASICDELSLLIKDKELEKIYHDMTKKYFEKALSGWRKTIDWQRNTYVSRTFIAIGWYYLKRGHVFKAKISCRCADKIYANSTDDKDFLSNTETKKLLDAINNHPYGMEDNSEPSIKLALDKRLVICQTDLGLSCNSGLSKTLSAQ